MPNLTNSFESFLNRLELPPEVLQKIERAQSLIEVALKNGLETFSVTGQGGGEKLTPKFIPQGSKVYKTVNYPCHVPPQQVDYDLGVYLPVSYHEENKQPRIAAHDYFSQVDSILSGLAQVHGWRIDRTKPTCSRLIVDSLIHVDVPLYSMPDVEFQRLSKALESERLIKNSRGESFVLDNEIEFWDDFDADKVLLCIRKGTWEPSDPRKISKAVKVLVFKHGEQLRRVWRYLKAWRDNLWPQGGPSSIYLMFAALKTYQSALRRDDHALLSALNVFGVASKTPVITTEDENLTNNQKPEDLLILEKASVSFLADLQQAINLPEDDGRAEGIVSKHLGSRFVWAPKPTKTSGKTDQEKAALIQQHHTQNPVTRPHFKNG